jgi:hypothetical protein
MRHLWLLVALWLSLPGLAQAQGLARWPSPLPSPPAQGGGEGDAAVLVGIEDYAFAPDIPGAQETIHDWYGWLRQARGVPRERIILLRDQEATADEMREALREAGSQVSAGGTLWFVFIGHGAPGQDGQDGVLVGADAQRQARNLYARSLSRRWLLDALAQGPQARSVALLDACFSGRAGSGEELVPGLQPLIPQREGEASQEGKVLVLSAGRGEDFAGALPGTRRPAFSYLTLGALRGWADEDGDGAVTAQEALDYSREALRLTLRDRKQVPQRVQGDAAQVLSRGELEAGPDLDAILLALPALEREAAANALGDLHAPAPLIFAPGELMVMRLNAGLTFLPRELLRGQTISSAYISDYLGDQSGATELTLGDTAGTAQAYSFGLWLVAAPRGFGVTTTFDVTWSPDLGTTALASGQEEQSAGEEGLERLFMDGERVGVRGIFLYHMGVEPHYRFHYEGFSAFGQVGVGFLIGGMTLVDRFAGDQVTPSIVEIDEEGRSQSILCLTVPLRAGLEYDLSERYGLSLLYSTFLTPWTSHQVQLGLNINL